MDLKIGLIAAALAAPAPVGAPLHGTAVAVDGDSLRIGDVRIRLFGIDAPESDQTCSRNEERWACGAAAAERLRTLVTGRDVRCISLGKDAYDRVLARCSLIGTDINQAMVETGYAVAFRKYSLDYVAAEERAKIAKRGLWSGTFENPADFRTKQDERPGVPSRQVARQRTKPSTRSTSGCAIKGNHSRRGEWIYHLPSMPHYEETRPEAIFCTEAEAQAAGYRRSRARW